MQLLSVKFIAMLFREDKEVLQNDGRQYYRENLENLVAKIPGRIGLVAKDLKPTEASH
jgi:hypothetical protein